MSTLSEKAEKILEKVEEHKAEIFMAIATAISVTTVVLIARNWASIRPQKLTGVPKVKDNVIHLVPATIQNTFLDATSGGKTVEVSKHIRNLPEGWTPSVEKLTAAISNGFELAENQTWVADYSRISA